MNSGLIDLDSVERVLAIMAHPDDVDFGAGGSIAALTSLGIAVSYCIVTDGDAGGFDPSIPRSEIPRIRRAEQTAAGAALGVTDIHFLGYHDGELEVTQAVRRDISRVIRKVRPDIVISQSPEINYDRIYASHPDHRAAGEAALIAVYPDARNPFAHTRLLADENLEAWSVKQVWLTGHPTRNSWMDTTATIERKIAALREHASQIENPAELPERITMWGGMQATEAGMPEGSMAEGYYVLDTR